MKAFLLALLLVAGTAHAAEWTPADTHRERQGKRRRCFSAVRLTDVLYGF